MKIEPAQVGVGEVGCFFLGARGQAGLDLLQAQPYCGTVGGGAGGVNLDARALRHGCGRRQGGHGREKREREQRLDSHFRNVLDSSGNSRV
jgi:hypothetical protein